MRNKTLPYCICILLTCATARAATVTPAYKLGDSYASDSSTSTTAAKCLEGHAGANLGSLTCKDLSEGCKNNSECVNRHGKGYVCAKGRDGDAKRGVCKYQECSGWGDTSCSTKYSHLRSCVKNELGVFECRITCNWQKIKEKGYAYIGSANIADRMKFEYGLWTNIGGTALNSAYVQSTIDYAWRTCKNGYITYCPNTKFEKTLSAAEWDDGQKGGLRYQPCLPCSIATGGTWGVGTEEDISKVGTRSYSMTASSAADIGHDLSRSYSQYKYEGDASGTSSLFPVYILSDRCGSKEAFVNSNLFTKLNYSTPFVKKRGGNAVKLEDSGFKNVVELGYADICYVWQTRGSGSRYVSGNRDGFSCKKYSTANCLQTTDMSLLVYVPKQSITKTFPTASTPTGGATKVSHNFNQPNGTLLCCRLATADGSDISGNYIKNCMVVKY